MSLFSEGEELLDCYLDLTLEGRITREERRRTLKGGYDFWCGCASCGQPSGDIESEDRLRREAFNLAQDLDKINLDNVFSLSKGQILEMIEKAERVAEIRSSLTFKLVHQLDNLERLFSFCMVAEEFEKAKVVAEFGEILSTTRYNEGKYIEEWRARKKDPFAYLIGLGGEGVQGQENGSL